MKMRTKKEILEEIKWRYERSKEWARIGDKQQEMCCEWKAEALEWVLGND